MIYIFNYSAAEIMLYFYVVRLEYEVVVDDSYNSGDRGQKDFPSVGTFKPCMHRGYRTVKSK